MGVFSNFLDDGVISPVRIIFCNVNCFPDKQGVFSIVFGVFLEDSLLVWQFVLVGSELVLYYMFRRLYLRC